jgi:hypothetical protein
MVPRFWQFETQMSTLQTFPPRAFWANAGGVATANDVANDTTAMITGIRNMKILPR